jgi:Mg/Co/Ni transporter MgtE
MGRHLQAAFAELEPDQFARLLSEAESTSEAEAILDAIPDGLECDVVSRMPAEATGRLLSAADNALLTHWLEAAPVDAGRRLLARLEKDRAGQLVAGIRDRSKRRGLRRLTDYPAGSVGELVDAHVLTVGADEPIEQVEALVAHSGASRDVPILVMRDNGSVMGLLDLMLLLQQRDSGLTASDLCIHVEPLNAAASIASLQLPAEWSRLTAMPVVDPSGQAIGFVSRASLERSTEFRSEGSLFLESAIELARRYWAFLFQVTELIFSKRPAR